MKLHVHDDKSQTTESAARAIEHGKRHDLKSRQSKLRSVLDCNAFDFGISDPESAGLCLHTSRINHSCVPDAEGYLDTKSDFLNVRALRGITIGEEITISYIHHILPREQRQELLSAWRFICQCPACDIRHPNSGPHEGRRTTINALQQDLLQYTGGSGPLSPAKIRSKSTLELATKKTQMVLDLLAQDYSLKKSCWRIYAEHTATRFWAVH